MKNGKATSPDDISVNTWKMFGECGAAFLTTLFNHIIADNTPPQTWTTSMTMLILKGKGDVSECTNHWPIQQLCHRMKISESVLDRHLQSIITLMPNQCGQVKGHGTTNAIHAAWLLMEKRQEKKQTLPQCCKRSSMPNRIFTTHRHHGQCPPGLSPFTCAVHPLHGHTNGWPANASFLNTSLCRRHCACKRRSHSPSTTNAEMEESTRRERYKK